MIRSLGEVAAQADPEGKILYQHTREDGLQIENRTVPFGTILIIYESRPDVTIEAAATAFKAGNRILLKGGKEAFHTNTLLTRLWQEALTVNGEEIHWVEYLNLNRGGNTTTDPGEQPEGGPDHPAWRRGVDSFRAGACLGAGDRERSRQQFSLYR